MASLGCFQVLLINIFTTAALKLSCGPGEELKPYIFTCEAARSFLGSDTITWRKGTQQVGACQPPDCLTFPSSSYTATVSNHTATLTVINVNRQSEGTYSCSVANPNNGTNSAEDANATPCDFRVYARPESVSCHQLERENDIVKVVCTVNRIFPNPICQFVWIQNGTERSFTQVFNYQIFSGPLNPEYFYGNCSLTLMIQNFHLGSHEFKVKAYPNVTGQASDTAYGINSSLTSVVKINYPTVTLESCPVRYILEGTLNSCTCRETSNNTFLPANASISTGSAILSSGRRYTTYNFNAARNTEELTCHAKVLNYTSVPVKYKPQVAYGPDNVSMKVMFNKMETDVTDWCDKIQPVTMTVNCSVLQNDVSPNATFDFHVNGTQVSSDAPVSTTVNYSISSAGPCSVKCTGKNLQFPEVLRASQEKIVYITEPPPSPPVIENYQESSRLVTGNENQLTVQEGMNRVRCRVEGGYPSVSSVSLECGTQRNTSVGNVAIVNINVNKHMDTSECSCTATHNSSCYRNNKTVSKMNILFEPTVVSFKANENPVQIIVTRNSDVRFSCEAEGNPSPSLSLIKDEMQLGVYSDFTKRFNLTLNINKTMTECKDTGAYTCQAQAGQTVIRRKVDIYVKCIQQLENSENQNKVYIGHLNKPLDISISVFGYPEPTVYLFSNTNELEKETYNLTYISRGSPYGSVSLKFYTVTDHVFQSYSLVITNVEGSLIYKFQIKESGSELNVGAVAGGIVAGILVVIAVVVTVVILKRKGLLKRGVKDRNTDSHMQTLSPDKETDLQYENILQEPNKEDELAYTHYEEIEDVHTGKSEKSSDDTDRDTHGGAVEYENTVSTF